jgi:hypothetical protein
LDDTIVISYASRVRTVIEVSNVKFDTFSSIGITDGSGYDTIVDRCWDTIAFGGAIVLSRRVRGSGVFTFGHCIVFVL